jgi:hypothetical protein
MSRREQCEEPPPAEADCEAQLQAVIEQYERLLDTRARLRREAEGEFVWTGDRGRE